MVLKPEESEAEGTVATDQSSATPLKINKRSGMVVLKAVFRRVPERGELVKILKGKFQAQSTSLMGLTPSQLNEMTARKLISIKYVSLKSGINSSDLRPTDLNMHRD